MHRWVLAVALAWYPATAAAQSIDVVELTVEEIQSAYAAGEYTAVELTGAFLDRIEQYEDYYNAFISMNPDALRRAAELDELYASSGPVGPLHGVPVVIKDNIDQAGRVTTAGFDGFSSATGGVDMIPDDNAAVVDRLQTAGAIILGKTNVRCADVTGRKVLKSLHRRGRCVRIVRERRLHYTRRETAGANGIDPFEAQSQIELASRLACRTRRGSWLSLT